MAEATLGMNMKLYFSSTLITVTGTAPASPTLAGNVKDVTNNIVTGETDTTTREGNGFRTTAATLKEVTITFQMQWKAADAFFTAIQTAFFAGTEIAIISLDKVIATAGAQGPMGNFTITSFTRNEPLEGAVTVDVTLKASSFIGWYTVSGS